MKAAAMSVVLTLSTLLAFAENNPSANSAPRATVGHGVGQQSKPSGDPKPGASRQNQNYNDVDSSSSDVVTSGGAGANSNKGNNH